MSDNEQGRQSMNIKYVHTNIISRDWRRLAQFYEDVFGCEVEKTGQ